MRDRETVRRAERLYAEACGMLFPEEAGYVEDVAGAAGRMRKEAMALLEVKTAAPTEEAEVCIAAMAAVQLGVRDFALEERIVQRAKRVAERIHDGRLREKLGAWIDAATQEEDRKENGAV